MKKAIFAVLAAVVLMVGCGGAHAQASSNIYTSTDGKVFSLEKVRKVEYTNGVITLTFENGESSYNYLSDNGTVFNKVKAANASWLTSGTSVIYNPAKARYIVCNNNQTTFAWSNSGSETLADSCTMYQQAVSKSN